jgi:hypothetical protein
LATAYWISMNFMRTVYIGIIHDFDLEMTLTIKVNLLNFVKITVNVLLIDLIYTWTKQYLKEKSNMLSYILL